MVKRRERINPRRHGRIRRGKCEVCGTEGVVGVSYTLGGRSGCWVCIMGAAKGVRNGSHTL